MIITIIDDTTTLQYLLLVIELRLYCHGDPILIPPPMKTQYISHKSHIVSVAETILQMNNVQETEIIRHNIREEQHFGKLRTTDDSKVTRENENRWWLLNA